ncbi:urease accessory protein UreD [filamentous cyanobacterium LEGE 07170]|nr:urease accessory protein UreD [filamentous cyanobacterium LEGE 07170]
MKVQRPFYPEGEVCHTVTLHTAGGIVGGDRLSTRLHLQPQTHALLTSATAGKLYRSNGLDAHQQLQVRLEAGACLEWLPQEVIAFNGAEFRQDTYVELAEDALWMGWELVRLGRTARGEQFLSGNWRSRTQIWQNGRLVWVDPQHIQGGSERLHHPHGLGGCPVMGSFAIVGQDVSAELMAQARDAWHSRTSPPDTPADAGVTQLMGGMLCRYRGFSTLEARRWFVAVWHLARLALCDRPACPPRVW